MLMDGLDNGPSLVYWGWLWPHKTCWNRPQATMQN